MFTLFPYSKKMKAGIRKVMALPIDKLPPPSEMWGVNDDNFQEKVASLHSPVVLREFVCDWPLVGEALISDQHALSYLKKYASSEKHNLVSLDKKHDGRMFYGNEDLTQFNFQYENVSIQHGLELMQQRLSGSDSASLCFQCLPLKKAFPGLVPQLVNPVLKERGSAFVWFGSEFKVAPHFDEAQNIAIVAAGKRRFTLFPPEQIENLYIGPLEHTPAGQPISLVDLHNPNLEVHPRYAIAYQHAMSVVLNPGDAIYIPSPWWHHVESLSNFNLLVNYWWSDNQTSTELPFPALIHAFQAFNNMNPGEKAAWHSFMKHFVFNDDSTKFDHIPDRGKGVLGKGLKNKAATIHNWIAQQLR